MAVNLEMMCRPLGILGSVYTMRFWGHHTYQTLCNLTLALCVCYKNVIFVNVAKRDVHRCTRSTEDELPP